MEKLHKGIVVFFAILLGLSILSILMDRKNHPYVLESDGKGDLVFLSNRDGDLFGGFEIYVMNIDGSQQTRLTYTMAPPEHTVLDRVAGWVKMKLGLALPLWVLNRHPVWSPDGSKLAFTSNRDGFNGIYVMDVENWKQTLLTKIESDAISTTWSPDGSKIVFDSLNGLTIINSDGSDLKLLDNTTTHIDDQPDWSPDGTKIVFKSSYRHERTGLLFSSEIYTMNVDGSEVTRLTYNEARSSEPVWSPDGQKIAYYLIKEGSDDIYVMNADGSEQTRLTHHPAQDMSPTWSPDGEKIAFVSDRDGNYEIYIMNADGSNKTRITFTADNWEPDWRP